MRINIFSRWILLVSFTAFFILIFNLSPAIASKKPKFIKIAASSMGGTWFPLAAATAEVLNQNIEGTTFTATLGGGVSNLKNIENGKILMGLGTGSASYMAIQGVAPFSSKAKNLRLIGVYYTYPYNLVVRANSNIHSIGDLRGKNLGVTKKGWSTEVACRNILKTAGLDYDEIKKSGGSITYAGHSQMRGMFKDRKLDFVPDSNNPPSPGIIELSTVTSIRLIDLGPQAIAKLKKINPGYSTIEIPAGTYKGQPNKVINLGDPTGMMVSADLDVHLVYNITKAIFENTGDIAKVHNVLKQFSLDNALNGAFLPLHPGALRYYEEKGIPIPSNLRP